MSRTPLVAGFALNGYRSFGGDELEAVSQMASVHLLAGPNNSGKSNILTAAEKTLSSITKNAKVEISDSDRPLDAPSDAGRRFTAAFRYEIADDDFDDLDPSNPLLEQLSAFMCRSAGVRSDAPGLWFRYELGKQNQVSLAADQLKTLQSIVAEENALGVVGPLADAMTGGRRGGVEGNSKKVFDVLREKLEASLPSVATIGAFRRIDADDSDNPQNFDGPGLIRRLAEIQNPGFVDRHVRARFDQITEFVRALFEDPDAQLEVPNSRDTLLIRHQGRWLPIDNYGTGLHEVIVLAAAATVLSNTLVCVEEPEIHLHPTLQRRLLGYLADSTDNQYLIATHSAHMLDSERASITAVRLVDTRSVIDAAVEPSEVAQISAGLGARASDLVQANAVIWVEGPSDRVYISGWIQCLAPHLSRGVHYEVMHYGGSLLRHLGANDLAIEEFVSLPRINRHFALVIDSDRSSRHAKVSGTKKRVKDEIDATDGTVVWMTTGYTIEDYIPKDILVEAVAAAHPGATCQWDGDKYRNPLAGNQVEGRRSDVDKTAIATEVMEHHWPNVYLREWPYDLRKRVDELILMIEKANDGVTSRYPPI